MKTKLGRGRPSNDKKNRVRLRVEAAWRKLGKDARLDDVAAQAAVSIKSVLRYRPDSYGLSVGRPAAEGGLTVREQEVLGALGRSGTVAAAAHGLGVTRQYVSWVRRKARRLGVENGT